MPHWKELPRPKFSDKEVSACKYLEDIGARPWTVDLLTKRVKTPRADFQNLITYAVHLGWNPEAK